jgi:D-cysteine desulfhydrase family pyridoxal phosphate-dependent enzyme
MSLTPADLRRALTRLPRVPLAHLPTPLERLPRLSAALGDVELWIKRDDCTGLALGGNKARQLEFTLGEAMAEGADCIVQGAGAQSNHCRQTAAAAARLGMDCHLVLSRATHSDEIQGNVLLDWILGAQIRWTETPLGPPLEEEKQALAAELRRSGRRPYVIGGTRGKVLGAAGYALQVCELAEQLPEAALQPDYLYVCSAGPTQAGILLGARALGLGFPVQAIAPIVWGWDVPAAVAATANEAAKELGVDVELRPEDVRHSEDYVGPAYGVLTREARMAIELVARTEGILLDPGYTGKAMAGLIDHVRRGRVRPGSRVVFVHTGGTPALFAYARQLLGGD